MGINSASYIILPKVVATVIFNPFLTLISIITGIIGGWIVGTSAGVITSQDYIYGIQYAFIPYYITYSLIKTVFFAFIISTVSAHQGYHVEEVPSKWAVQARRRWCTALQSCSLTSS